MSLRVANVSTMWINVLLENYGTFFQHYCLREVLVQLGFSPRRYLAGRKPFVGWRVMTYFLRRGLSLRSRPLDFIYEVFSHVLFSSDYHRLIGRFHEKCRFSTDDVCIMGSDQILSDNPEDWFYSVSVNCRRVMYAGSTDWTRQSKNVSWARTAGSELKKFSAVSVREEAGVVMCQAHVRSGVNVMRVVDPVILVNPDVFERSAMARMMFRKPTLFVYLVNVSNDVTFDFKLLLSIAERLGCDIKVLAIQGSASFVPRKYRVLLRPSEFLSAFRDARYVITNSFHGTAFALINRKPFVTICQGNIVGCNFNNRQQELLGLVGLPNRLQPLKDVDLLVKILSLEYDVERVDDVLRSERNRSFAWLKGSLS